MSNILTKMVTKILPKKLYLHLRDFNDYYIRYNLFVRSKQYKEIDYFVISFPKCGRTWLRTILGKYFELAFRIPFTTELFYVKTEKVPRIQFSHELRDIKNSKQRRVVYLIRDPRDVVVSYYYQLTMREKILDGSISDFVRDKKYGIRKIIGFMNCLNDEKKKKDLKFYGSNMRTYTLIPKEN